MKIMRCCLMFVVGIAWVAQALSVIDRGLLRFKAGEFGNKTENLEILTTGGVCDPIKVSGTSYHVEVPAFTGISHAQVSDYLVKKLGHSLADEWQHICHEHLWPGGNREAALQKLLDTRKYPEAFLMAVEELRTRIKRAFTDVVFTFDEGQTTFITATHARDNRLMVRSTGKEDTKELANAGGNETVANVESEPAAISKAMGIVVASYIGQKSLKQRLAVVSKDHVNEIVADPFVPVLLQVMIGERRNGQRIEYAADVAKIPVSGVMFTTEAEGQTQGLTHIQTTYGHNEGVVASLVPVDTWYIGPSHIVYPVIRKKWQRLVPIDAGGLEKRDNHWDFGDAGISCVERPTLLYSDALALKRLADKIERYYGQAMDVEFVLMPQEKTIYLLQARPIVFGEKNPEYLTDDFVRGVGETRMLRGVKIGVGRAQVHEILAEDQVLIDDRLADALRKYLSKSDEERKKIACVVVREMAAATSHEATTFRAENMSVMQLEDLDKLRAWVATSDARVVFDIQRGMLCNVKGPFDKIPGWFEFPVARQLSVGVVTQPMKKSVRFIRFLDKVSKSETIQVAAHAKMGSHHDVLLDELKAWQPDGTARAFEQLDGVVAVLLWKLQNALPGVAQATSWQAFLARLSTREEVEGGARRLLGLTEEMTAQQEMGMHIFDMALLCCNDVLAQVRVVEHARDVRMLCPLHFFQALFAQVRHKQVVAPLSMADIIVASRQDIRALKRSAAAEPTMAEVNLLKLVDASFSDETSAHWTDFVHQVLPARLPEALKRVGQANISTMLSELGQLDALPLWLNVVFESAVSSSQGHMVAVAKKLIHDFREARPFLAQLKEKKQALDTFDVAAFDDPEKFAKMWPALRGLAEFFMSDPFLQTFNRRLLKGNLSQLVALNSMYTMVDVFDRSIKAMTGSTVYKRVEEKVANFKTMLDVYWSLFAQWVDVVPPNTFAAVGSGFLGQDAVKEYVAKYGSFVRGRLMGVEQLKPSSRFDVAACVLGSAVLSDVVAPPASLSLEDYFTLTHQNLHVVTNALTCRLGGVDVVLPAWVTEIRKRLETSSNYVRPNFIYDKDVAPKLVGIQFQPAAVTFMYNCPLRSHSASIKLTYSRHKNQVNIDTTLIGGNEYNRWERLGDFIEVVNTVSHFAGSIRVGKMSVSFDWDLNERSDISKIPLILGRVVDFTFTSTHPDYIKTVAFRALSFLFSIYGDAAESVARIIEVVIDLSLSKGRVHWLLPQVVGFSYFDKVVGPTREARYDMSLGDIDHILVLIGRYWEVDREAYISKVAEIFDRLTQEKSRYAVASDFFWFKTRHDPRDPEAAKEKTEAWVLYRRDFLPNYYELTLEDYHTAAALKEDEFGETWAQYDNYYPRTLLPWCLKYKSRVPFALLPRAETFRTGLSLPEQVVVYVRAVKLISAVELKTTAYEGFCHSMQDTMSEWFAHDKERAAYDLALAFAEQDVFNDKAVEVAFWGIEEDAKKLSEKLIDAGYGIDAMQKKVKTWMDSGDEHNAYDLALLLTTRKIDVKNVKKIALWGAAHDVDKTGALLEMLVDTQRLLATEIEEEVGCLWSDAYTKDEAYNLALAAAKKRVFIKQTKSIAIWGAYNEPEAQGALLGVLIDEQQIAAEDIEKSVKILTQKKRVECAYNLVAVSAGKKVVVPQAIELAFWGIQDNPSVPFRRVLLTNLVSAKIGVDQARAAAELSWSNGRRMHSYAFALVLAASNVFVASVVNIALWGAQEDPNFFGDLLGVLLKAEQLKTTDVETMVTSLWASHKHRQAYNLALVLTCNGKLVDKVEEKALWGLENGGDDLLNIVLRIPLIRDSIIRVVTEQLQSPDGRTSQRGEAFREYLRSQGYWPESVR